MIGNEVNCLKKVGRFQLKEANTQCQSFNANQILPRSRQESDNLFSALLSLDLDSENGNTIVSIGIHKTKEEQWREIKISHSGERVDRSGKESHFCSVLA